MSNAKYIFKSNGNILCMSLSRKTIVFHGTNLSSTENGYVEKGWWTDDREKTPV